MIVLLSQKFILWMFLAFELRSSARKTSLLINRSFFTKIQTLAIDRNEQIAQHSLLSCCDRCQINNANVNYV